MGDITRSFRICISICIYLHLLALASAFLLRCVPFLLHVMSRWGRLGLGPTRWAQISCMPPLLALCFNGWLLFSPATANRDMNTLMSIHQYAQLYMYTHSSWLETIWSIGRSCRGASGVIVSWRATDVADIKMTTSARNLSLIVVCTCRHVDLVVHWH